VAPLSGFSRFLSEAFILSSFLPLGFWGERDLRESLGLNLAFEFIDFRFQFVKIQSLFYLQASIYTGIVPLSSSL